MKLSSMLSLRGVGIAVGIMSTPLAADDVADGNAVFFGHIGASTLDRAVNPAPEALGGQFEVTASTENSNAKLRLGQARSSWSDRRPDGTRTGYFNTFELLLSAPLDQKRDDKRTEVATLDGLANSFWAELRYTSFRRPGLDINKMAQLPDTDACKAAADNYAAKNKGEQMPHCDFGLIEKWAPDAFEATYNEFLPPAKLSKPNTWRSFWGVSARIGYEEYDYVRETDLEKENDQKAPWSAGAHVGALLPMKKSTTLLTLGYDYQETYELADGSTVCPQSTEARATCVTGSVGEPDKVIKSLGYAEIRGLVFGAGFSLRYTHDFNQNVNGVDLPIYIFRNKANALNGGVRFGYNDKDDEFEAGIFVGTQFLLFGS